MRIFLATALFAFALTSLASDARGTFRVATGERGIRTVHVTTPKGNTCELGVAIADQQKPDAELDPAKYIKGCDYIKAHPFDESKHVKVTVTASNGEKCTMDVEGGDTVDPDTEATIQQWCERQQRGKAILAITGPTEADMMAMSPGDRAKAFQALRCKDVREKLEVQRDMEAAGSTGYYNKDALLRLERQECGSNAAP